MPHYLAEGLGILFTRLYPGTVIIIACRPCVIYEGPTKHSLLNGYILLLIATVPFYTSDTPNKRRKIRAYRFYSHKFCNASLMANVVFCLRNIAVLNLHNELAEDRVSADVLNILQTALKMFNFLLLSFSSFAIYIFTRDINARFY